jgi:hypothetical protein
LCKPVLHFCGHVHREVDATSAFRDVFCLMGTSEPPNPFRGARFANHTFDTRRTRRARPLGFRHAPGFMSQLFWDAFVGDWLQTLTACVAHHDNSERLEAHKHREQPRSSAREKCTPRSDKPSESVHLPPPSGPADEILAAVSAALSRLPSPAKESTQAGPGHTEKARALLQVSKRTKLCEMTVNPLHAHILMRVCGVRASFDLCGARVVPPSCEGAQA